MTGAPGNATGILAVAASDIIQSFPGATIDRTTGADLNGINENDWPGLPVTGTLKVITDNPARHPAATVTSTWAASRSTTACCRPTRSPSSSAGSAPSWTGVAAEAAGAIGVIINRDAAPLELPPSSATPRRSSTSRWSASARRQADPPGLRWPWGDPKAGPSITNGAYLATPTSFRRPPPGDNAQKPDVSAPGVNITSTAVGLGYKGDTCPARPWPRRMSPAPPPAHARGHSTWKPGRSAAIVGTAVDRRWPLQLPKPVGHGPASSRGRHGRLRAGDDRTPNISFGYDQVRLGQYRETKAFTIYNTGSKDITYTLKLAASSPQQDRGDGQGAQQQGHRRHRDAQLAARGQQVCQPEPPGGTASAACSATAASSPPPPRKWHRRYTLRVLARRPAGGLEHRARGEVGLHLGRRDLERDHQAHQQCTHASFADVYAWGFRSEGPAQRGHGHERHPRGGPPVLGRVPHRSRLRAIAG